MSQELAKAEAAVAAEDIPTTVELVQEFVILREEDLVLAAEALGDIKARFNRLEAERKKMTVPILEFKAQVDSWFRPATTALQEAERILKMKMGEAKRVFDTARAMEAARKRNEAAAAVKADDMETALAAVAEAVEADAPVTVSGAQFREVWTFEITDPALVPNEYRIISPPEIGKAVKRGVREIPGVRIFQEHVVASVAPKKG